MPVLKGTTDLAFSKGSDRDMWVSLLEKCWAKSCGGYDKIIGGKTKEALRVLTGAPTTEYNHNELEQERLWKKIKYADNNRYIMTAALKAQTDS